MASAAAAAAVIASWAGAARASVSRRHHPADLTPALKLTPYLLVVNKTAELIDDPDEKTPSGCGAAGCGWCMVNMFTGGFGCM